MTCYFQKCFLFTRKHPICNNILKRGTKSKPCSLAQDALSYCPCDPYKVAALKDINAPIETDWCRSNQKLRPNQVRLDVHYCTINFTDVLLMTGKLKVHNLSFPFTPGYEIAGEVIEIHYAHPKGEMPYKIGDRVVALKRKTGFGGLATRCIADIQDVWALPYNVSYKAGVVYPCDYSNAMIAFTKIYSLQEGDTVVISVGASDFGLAAVDLAVNVFKAVVVAVVDSQTRAELVRDIGAFVVLSYLISSKCEDADEEVYKLFEKPREPVACITSTQQQSMKSVDEHDLFGETKGLEVITEITKAVGPNGPKLIYDTVGGIVLCLLTQCVKKDDDHAKIITSHALYNAEDMNKLSNKLFQIDASKMIHFSYIHSHRGTDVYRDTVSDVLKMAEEEYIEPLASQEYYLHQINDAILYIQGPKCLRKVVINLDQRLYDKTTPDRCMPDKLNVI